MEDSWSIHQHWKCTLHFIQQLCKFNLSYKDFPIFVLIQWKRHTRIPSWCGRNPICLGFCVLWTVKQIAEIQKIIVEWRNEQLARQHCQCLMTTPMSNTGDWLIHFNIINWDNAIVHSPQKNKTHAETDSSLW